MLRLRERSHYIDPESLVRGWGGIWGSLVAVSGHGTRYMTRTLLRRPFVGMVTRISSLLTPPVYFTGWAPTSYEFFLRPPRAGLRVHTYRLLQGPSRFGEGAVPFLSGW